MQSDRSPPPPADGSAVRDRLLCTLKHARPLVFKRADGRRPLTLPPADAAARQIIWLRGSVQVETSAASTLHLAPGSIWSPAPADKAILRNLFTTEASGIELTFDRGLAADYAAFLTDHFGSLVRIPIREDALRRAKSLLDSDTAPLRYAQKIFAWLSALHAVLDERHMQLTDLLHGPSDRLRDECVQHGYSLKALSSHLRCTPAFLAARLSRAWGQPAGEALRQMRHEHACQLLATTSASLAEIAWRCGFSSPAAFCTAVKKRAGLTPSQIRAARSATSSTPRIVANRGPSITPPPMPKIREQTPMTVWSGPYFQLDGGEADWPYETPYELALNGITDAVHWVYTLEGEAVFEVGETSLVVKPGTLVVHPQPLNARWLTPTGKPWHRIWVIARGPWASDALIELARAHGWAATLSASSQPVKLARHWARYWNEHRNEPSIVGSQAAYAWLLSWWRLLLAGKVTPVPLPDLSKAHSRSFFRRIKTITRYAEEIGYSRGHISRKLRGQWDGGTPAQVIRRQRLAQAALELRHTRLSVAEIAQRAQFASANSFIPAFKREFGATPLAYRFSQT